MTRPTNPNAEELIGRYFSVLDYGFVALVDYMGTDQCIESAARVSFGRGTRQTSDTRTLIRYLKRHLHTTPFEMVEFKFHCAMPIFVARQWIRHRTANVNEYSGRYSLMPMVFYTPDQEHVKLQSETNKQGRSETELEPEKYSRVVKEWSELRERSQNLYEWLTEEDVARELARIDLPLSTYTQWYWKIDLHNLMHFLKLRVDSHAQYEIRAFAEPMAGMMKIVAPIAAEAWIDYDVCGVRFSYDEMQAIRTMLSVFQKPSESVFVGSTVEFDRVYETMTSRELGEFESKLAPRTRPTFDLDLSKAHDASLFEKIFGGSKP